ncbi:MAG TPA: response regulator [Acidimicrobiales bacterium]|nr:response regulator [Acidimicrobiales bacterium]
MAGQVDVLVVDDHEAIRASVADLLQTAGYSVAEASDGASALQVLASRKVGAMVLDLRMPGIDGLKVLDMLDDPPPVIITSAFTLDDDDQQRVDPKIFVQLVKPFHPRRLIDAVASAIGQRPQADVHVDAYGEPAPTDV